MGSPGALELVLGFAGVCVVNAAAVGGIWLQSRMRSDRTDAKIDRVGAGVTDAAVKADTVAKRVEPVSNGFASAVLEKLDRLKAGQDAMAREVRRNHRLITRHLRDHDSGDADHPDVPRSRRKRQ